LDQGRAPDEFGFHLFRSDLEQKGDYYTLNVYFYLPRGQCSLTDEESENYIKYLLTRMERMLPNITQAIRYREIITPYRFEKIHGLSSRVMPFVSHDNKPLNQGRESGLYYAGHTVSPQGEHAGAAALSGYLVAQKILRS
jgi:phytoene dehydrogenase-like protein